MAGPSTQLDYYTFMGHRADVLLERYRPYAERFRGAAAVLDVGCGRGEFLELLREVGAGGVGIDADAAMVVASRAKGLEAVEGDAREYLAGRPDSLDGVFAAHLIEHLRPEDVVQLVRDSARALRPGGRLLLVTPNPHNLNMQLREFWTDLQHVRFYTPEIVAWILTEAGLHQVETGENSLYVSGPEIIGKAPPRVGRAPVRSPRQRPRLGRVATARQVVAQRLQAASALERLADLEIQADAASARIEELTRELRETHDWVDALRHTLLNLYPAGEFFATGVR